MASEIIDKSAPLSSLESFLLPVIVPVLEYLDLASRFRIAATSRSFQNAVFGKEGDNKGVDDSVKTLWETLDFSGLKSLEREQLTDDRVRAILEHVRAREVTKVFNLAGYNNLNGTFLVALKGSQVLEQITFETKKCEITYDFAWRIFRPMMRSSLYYIRMHAQSKLSNAAETNWSIRTNDNRSVVPCSKCNVWKYECTLTSCRRCRDLVCNLCAGPSITVNKCVSCKMMIQCLDCSGSSRHGDESIIFCGPCLFSRLKKKPKLQG